jgi:hypothetical protein
MQIRRADARLEQIAGDRQNNRVTGYDFGIEFAGQIEYIDFRRLCVDRRASRIAGERMSKAEAVLKSVEAVPADQLR